MVVDRLPATISGLSRICGNPQEPVHRVAFHRAQPFTQLEHADSFLHFATQTLPFMGVRSPRKLKEATLESDVWAHLELLSTRCSKTMAALLLRRRLVWPYATKERTYTERRTRDLLAWTQDERKWEIEEPVADLPPSALILFSAFIRSLEVQERDIYTMGLIRELLSCRSLELTGLQTFFNYPVLAGPLKHTTQTGQTTPDTPESAARRTAAGIKQIRPDDSELLLGLLRHRCSIRPAYLQP